MSVGEVIMEFIDSEVMNQDYAKSLYRLVDLESNNFTYPEQVSYITLLMLKQGLYNKFESTPIRQALRDLFDQNPVEYNKLKSGDSKLTGFFVGRSMKISKNFNPKDVQKRIAEMIEESNYIDIWEE